MHAASFHARAARKSRLDDAEVSVTGSAHSGGTLTSHFTGTGLNKLYQWFRNDAPIAAATSATYQNVGADVGKQVKCRVGFTGASGFNEYIFSEPVSVT